MYTTKKRDDEKLIHIYIYINVGESSAQRGVVEVVLACCGCSKNIQYSGLANSWADTVDPNPSKRSKNLMTSLLKFPLSVDLCELKRLRALTACTVK